MCCVGSARQKMIKSERCLPPEGGHLGQMDAVCISHTLSYAIFDRISSRLNVLIPI
jgi:hypothetical protein